MTPAFDMRVVAGPILRSTVTVGQRSGFGTGILWLPNLVLTNDHVVRSDHPTVRLSEGAETQGQVIARDPKNDLAAVRLKSTGKPIDQIADSNALEVGQLVIAIGHPLGLRDTMSLGIVSGASGESWMGPVGRDLIQVDVSLAPGNSGGPIVDMDGLLVGIATMVASPGIALAIPARVVADFVDRISRSSRWVA